MVIGTQKKKKKRKVPGYVCSFVEPDFLNIKKIGSAVPQHTCVVGECACLKWEGVSIDYIGPATFKG